MALTKATQAVIAVDICTTDTAQTITGVKTFTSAISAPNIPAANMVTTDTAQTITGVKTFTSAISAPNMVTTDTAQTITGVKTISNDTLINGLTVGKGSGNIASNTASGASALAANTTGLENTAVGSNALNANTTGSYNTASGESALNANTTGTNNTASGAYALLSNTTGGSNTASGANALLSNTTGGSNTASGSNALQSNTTGNYNTASGINALAANTIFSNIGGLGYNTQVTGSNQIQLGDAATTTYAYGAVQDRSDIRDKADVRDTELGLEFVNALRPVDFKWDMREDYRPEAPKSVVKPAELKEDASDEDKAKYAEELAAYKAYVVLKDKWLEDVKLANITHDGSKKRNRFHHGLIAQEVKAVLDAKGIDFGGFQDHSVNGGDDVLSIGYEELIAPLIKAVQELSAKVAELESK